MATAGLALLLAVGYQYHTSSSASKDNIFHQDAATWYNLELEQKQAALRQEECPPQLFDSLFVNGSQNVPIAVDVYLPCDYDTDEVNSNGESGKKTTKGYPLYFHITRYGRRLSVRWPFSIFMGSSINTRSKVYMNTFVPHGYALVTMDVSGSGASGGSRSGDLLESEVDDYEAVLEWARAQPWFDTTTTSEATNKAGFVISGGISYDGMAAAALAARGLLDVAMLVFAPINTYEELGMPGGVPCHGFVHPYSVFTTALETATALGMAAGPMGLFTRFFFNVVIEGPSPPTMSGALQSKVEENAQLTRKHLKEHEKNWDMRTLLQTMQFSDDVAVPKSETNGLQEDYKANQLGINPVRLEKISSTGVKVMSYSGYYDSGAVRSSAAIFAAVKRGNAHVTIGPWTHGLRQSSSPFSTRSTPAFSLGVDMLRFMEYTRGKTASVDGLSAASDPLVRVFELESHTWHAVDSMDWADALSVNKPSEQAMSQSYHYFDSLGNSNETLSKIKSSDEQEKSNEGTIMTLLKPVTPISLVGVISRWNLIQQILLKSVTTNIDMNKNKELASAFATYTVDMRRPAASSEEDSRVHQGMVLIDAKVRVRSPPTSRDDACASDASLFFYLMLDDGSGDLKYLTETQLRLGHGPLDQVQRNFARENFQPLQLDHFYALQVALEPLRFRWHPSTQKLVLLVGRSDDTNFFASHPLCNQIAAEAVDLKDVSMKLPSPVYYRTS